MEVQFNIFKPSKAEKITVNKIILGITCTGMGIAFFSAIILGNSFRKFEITLLWISIIALSVGVFIFKIIQHWWTEPYMGSFEGYVVLSNDNIKIGYKKFLLKDIANINITANDYINRYTNPSRIDFNPARSNGTKNTIIMRTTDGHEFSARFQQEVKDQILNEKELIVEYYQQNKISFMKLTEILQLNNYKEIQEFKRTLNQSPPPPT